MSDVLEKMKEAILSQHKIAIISHSNPDGDTLGSQLALANAVSPFGIETRLINESPVSSKFHFLPMSQTISPLKPGEELPEVVVFVDCATLERASMDDRQALLAGKTILNLDHHPSNTQFGTLNFVISQAAANCQVIYELIKVLGAELTKDVATALYLGLSTDTGSFLFDSVSADTHRLAAVLIDAQADTAAIRSNLYESMTRAKFELQKHIFNNTQLSADGRLAWSTFDRALLERTQADSADIDGLINSIKNIEGVEIAILFREIEAQRVKISFRSKMWADVNQLAACFGGGGHVRAAGCTILEAMPEVQEKVLREALAVLAKGE